MEVVSYRLPRGVQVTDADRARTCFVDLFGYEPCASGQDVITVKYLTSQILSARSSQREADAALVEDAKWCIDPVKCALGETACSHECGIRRRLATAVRGNGK